MASDEVVIPVMPPFDELPDALREVSRESWRKFVWAYVFSGANGAAAARAAGYSDVAGGARVRAHEILQHEEVGRAVDALSRRYFFSLAPKAILRLDNLLDNPSHPKHDRAISMVVDRVAPVKSQVDVNLTGEIKVNHTDAALENLRQLKALGVPRERLLEVFGFSGLDRYEKMLASQTAKVIEHQP